MTEISKVALERARELRNRIYSGGEIYTLADATMRASPASCKNTAMWRRGFNATFVLAAIDARTAADRLHGFHENHGRHSHD